MHIGYIGNTAPPVGGAEVFLGQFLTHFTRRKSRHATLVRWRRQIFREGMVKTYAGSGTVKRSGGVATHYLFDSKARRKYQRRTVYQDELERHHFLQGEQAGKILRRAGVDLVHAQMLFPNLLFAGVAAEISNVPLVLTIHGMLEFEIMDRNRKWCPEIVARVEGLIKRADAVIAISEEIADECRRRGARRVVKIPGGIDTEFFSPSDGGSSRGRDVLFVGSVRKDKGAHLLIDAFERFEGNGVEGDLVFIGNRLIHGKVYEQARRNPRIRFVGTRSPAQVQKALQKALMLVLPSQSEGLPLSVLEAMSCQRPVLVTATGELTRVVKDKRNGFIIPERTSKSIAESILAVASRSDLARIGEKARKAALEYDIRTVVAKHETLYRDLLRRPRRK